MMKTNQIYTKLVVKIATRNMLVKFNNLINMVGLEKTSFVQHISLRIGLDNLKLIKYI